MQPLNQSSNPWIGGTLHRQQRWNSSRPLQLGRSCVQCFGTVKALCLLPQGSTVNTGVYCDILKKLRCVIQNKERGMLSWGVVMIHDNARPHNDTTMQNLITKFGWEQSNYPPSSPDLAPSDFHLSVHLKSFLAGWKFHDNEVKEAITTCFAS